VEQSIAGGVVNADADLCSGDMDGISLRSEVRLGAKAAEVEGWSGDTTSEATTAGCIAVTNANANHSYSN